MTSSDVDRAFRDRLRARKNQVAELIAAEAQAETLRTEVVGLRDDLERARRRLAGFLAAGKKPLELLSDVVHPDFGVPITFVSYSKLSGDELAEQASADIAHLEGRFNAGNSSSRSCLAARNPDHMSAPGQASGARGPVVTSCEAGPPRHPLSA